MPKKQIVRLSFPMGGRADRYAFQEQPPLTTVSASNVWPDAIGRERGGSRPGFTKRYADALSGAVVGLGTLNYVPGATSRVVSRLVAIDAAGGVYVDDGLGSDTLTHVGTLAASSELLSMTERNQKLYIAGHSVSQSDSEASNTLKCYDPNGLFGDVIATAGTVPRGCPCICTWRDRIVLAGGTTDPYGIFMSRQGDPEDWDYSVTDASGAVNVATANAGQISDTVTSVTPHADNCLLVGCPSSLWIILGDPRNGGQVANLSSAIGVVDRHAWCKTPDNLFVFLSADGLYMIPAGCSMDGNPVSLSRERLPTALLNVNTQGTSDGKAVSLAYDIRWRGVHIFVTDRGATAEDAGSVHYFFDWETKSFWEVQYALSTFDPWRAHARPNMPSSESVVVMGCTDGYLRQYLSTATRDDYTEETERKIASYVTLGPFGDDPALQNDVRLDELDVTLGSGSRDVTWSIFRGNSAEQAAENITNNLEAAKGRVSQGRNYRFLPRVRGAALFLKLYSTSEWALEAATCVLAKLGRTRV